MSDDEVRAHITQIRGFGRWSADYILIRGLGRPDCVPADDLGVRTVIGRYLGNGSEERGVLRYRAGYTRGQFASTSPQGA